MIPLHAVEGAAGAVGGLADSGVVVGMTRGRLWIAVLGVLLGGIVALNVWGLSLSASTSATALKVDELERKNSVLEATNARRQSSDRIQEAAARLGLITPTPQAIDFLRASGKDAERAAERLAGGEISVLGGLVAPEFATIADAAAGPVEPPVTSSPAPVPEPEVPAPAATDPTGVVPPAPAAPVAPAPTTTEPATAPPPGGGITP